MTEGAFHQPRKTNRTALTIVVLMHGAAITALALSKTEFITEKLGTLTVIPVTPDPPPPEVPPEPIKPQVEPPQHVSVVTVTPPIIQPPIQRPIFDAPPIPPTPIPYTPPAQVHVEPTPPPPPPPAPKKLEPARAKANLASYVSDADYPASAQRNEEQGTTRFRLSVGPDGRVTECTVTGSSGSSALDAATCRIMKSRARFEAARDSSGNKTSDTVSSAIKWVLPAD